MRRTFSTWRTARGYTLLEGLAVAVVIGIMLAGIAMAGGMAFERRKSSATVEELSEISNAVHDFYGASDSYAGISAAVVATKLPASYVQTVAGVTTLVSPYGTTITVGIDTAAAGTKPVLGNQGVMLSMPASVAACADLTMALQGSYDYIVVGDVSPQLVSSGQALVATPDSALAACTANQPLASKRGGGVPSTLYLVRT